MTTPVDAAKPLLLDQAPAPDLPPQASIYAEPRDVTDLSECYFYHTLELPGYGRVEGQFDLNGSEHKYLGNLDFSGKRVLEVGTASGALCFYMERMGAEVVALDLCETLGWDLVPFAGYDYDAEMEARSSGLRLLNNSWWLGHKAFGSKAKVIYSAIYDLPEAVGPVDITTFTAVLTHMKDPFEAIRKAASVTREKIVVSEILWYRFIPALLLSYITRPALVFLPDFRTQAHWDAWWFISPKIIREFLGVHGFEDTKVTYHLQKGWGKPRITYTVVGTRTRPFRSG